MIRENLLPENLLTNTKKIYSSSHDTTLLSVNHVPNCRKTDA